MVERDRSEELAKRMTKSLKSRAVEALSAEGEDGGAGNDGAPPKAKAAANGSAIGSENGDEVRVYRGRGSGVKPPPHTRIGPTEPAPPSTLSCARREG